MQHLLVKLNYWYYPYLPGSERSFQSMAKQIFKNLPGCLYPIHKFYLVTVWLLFFFVFCANVPQIVFERGISGDTGVGTSTGESFVDILGVCIHNELSGVKDR